MFSSTQSQSYKKKEVIHGKSETESVPVQMNKPEETQTPETKRFLINETNSLRDIYLSYSDKQKNSQAMSSSMDTPSKSSGSSSDNKRPSDSSLPSSSSSSSAVKTEKKTPFRRVRSPSRPRAWLSKVPTSAYKIPGFYKPRYHVHHHEYPFRKPGFHFGFRPYHHFPPGSGGYFHRRDHPPSALDIKREKDRIREREKERDMKRDKDRKDDKSSSPKDSLTAPLTPLFPRSSSSREKDKQLNASQEIEKERGRESSTLSRITARNRAIQQKRREIEEVYRQDCDTFAVVVRMLIAKDPLLEPTLQASLQDNLRDIGHRCVEAMQTFIEEYDSKHPKDPAL